MSCTENNAVGGAEVRNYYGRGVQELYREANKDDPKEILDGVTVAGLVSILRQLGDLAEYVIPQLCLYASKVSLYC